jgi:hypothetical protein
MGDRKLSLWEGQFVSSQYNSGFVQGKVYVKLIDPEEVKETYDTSLTLIYEGIYRKGFSIEIPIHVTSSKEANGILLTSLSSQELAFETFEVSKNHIRGFYTSKNPIDQGKFILSKSLQNDLPSLSSLSVPHCSIC